MKEKWWLTGTGKTGKVHPGGNREEVAGCFVFFHYVPTGYKMDSGTVSLWLTEKAAAEQPVEAEWPPASEYLGKVDRWHVYMHADAIGGKAWPTAKEDIKQALAGEPKLSLKIESDRANAAGLIEQLASPSQKERGEAAEKLLKVFQPTPRDKWAPVVATIEVGETKEKILARLKEAMAEVKVEMGVGTGASHMEFFRLDDCWVVEAWFQNQGDILREISLVERMRHIWVEPDADFTGQWITYFPNGQKSHKIDYRNGKYFGEFIAYRPDGTKSFVQHYGEEGVDGEDTGYFPSGRVSYRAFYKAGKPVGKWTWFNEDGSTRNTEDKGSN